MRSTTITHQPQNATPGAGHSAKRGTAAEYRSGLQRREVMIQCAGCGANATATVVTSVRGRRMFSDSLRIVTGPSFITHEGCGGHVSAVDIKEES